MSSAAHDFVIPMEVVHDDDRQQSSHIESDWLEPVPVECVRKEQQLFEDTKTEMNRIWEEECGRYELTKEVTIRTGHGLEPTAKTVPLRNYINSSGIIQDTSLFPYHSALYPLLDAYDCLFDDQSDEEPVDVDAYRAFPNVPIEFRQLDQQRDDGIEFIDQEQLPGYMPSSIQSVIESLVLEDVNWNNAELVRIDIREFYEGTLNCFSNHHLSSLMGTSSTNIVQHLSCLTSIENDPNFWKLALTNLPEPYRDFLKPKESTESIPDGTDSSSHTNFPSCSPKLHGINHLPSSRLERSTILLKLLRHSLSELQRDYKISGAAILCLMRFHDLDEVSVLRRFLAIIDSEYILCGFPCDDDDAVHLCRDWEMLVLSSFKNILGFGITMISDDHVSCLLGFVRSVYLREFGHLIPISGPFPDEDKSTMKLKRELAVARGEATESNNRIPTSLVAILIGALGSRASLELNRLHALRQNEHNESIRDDVYSNYFRSYHNCLRAIVHIGEMSIQVLPESERFYPVASEIVKAMYYSLTVVESLDELFPREPPISGVSPYLGLSPRHHDKRLTCPLRFSDAVENATDIHKRFRSRNTTNFSNCARDHRVLELIDEVLRGRPPDVCRMVVKTLFVRDLVDVRQARLGFGDFLLWCRFEINLEDSLLYTHDYQYPIEEDASDVSSNSDAEDEWEEWDCDENALSLSMDQTRAWYDFSLMSLARAWGAPWRHQNHMSFQPAFRQAITTVALCTHRLEMPVDVVHRIGSFMNREWWFDERRECWNSDCQIASVSKAVEAYSEDMLQDGSSSQRQFAHFLAYNKSSSKPCLKCNVPKYCSKRCKDDSYKTSHASCCGKPQCSTAKLSPEEYQLYIDVFSCDEMKGTKLPYFVRRMQDKALEEANSTADERIKTGDDDDDDDGWEDDDGTDEDNDDAGSWESVNSDSVEGKKLNPTEIICKFFKKNSYETERF